MGSAGCMVWGRDGAWRGVGRVHGVWLGKVHGVGLIGRVHGVGLGGCVAWGWEGAW